MTASWVRAGKVSGTLESQFLTPSPHRRSEQELQLDHRAVVEDAAGVVQGAALVGQVEVDLVLGGGDVHEPEGLVAAAQPQPVQDVEVEEEAGLVDLAGAEVVVVVVDAGEAVAA